LVRGEGVKLKIKSEEQQGQRVMGEGILATAASAGAEAGITAGRKADHIRINAREDVSAKGITSGFERYRFRHAALPEIDLDQVDPSTTIFGYRLAAPILISCMTGGVPEAEPINRRLARTAQRYRFALGLGSARVLLERPEALSSFAVRGDAPDVPLLANLGAVQLNKGVGVDDCRRIVDLLRADALVLHLNALQEALQPEGDTAFTGLLSRIEDLCRRLDVPVVAKEIGWGISADIVQHLLNAGVSAVDVAGAGGTSWSEVERHRMGTRLRARVAAAFADWGIPSAEAIRDARMIAPHAILFASGGIRDGIDAAKAVALGADLVGLAGPFLRAAAQSDDASYELAEELIEVMRIAMFATGAADLSSLRNAGRLVPLDGDRATARIHHLAYATSRARDFVDITDDVAAAVHGSGIQDGIAHVCSPHTTAAISINENEPLLIADFQEFLDRLVPNGEYRHNDIDHRHSVPADEPRNGQAHLQHLLLSSSESITVAHGKLQLGQWQRIFLIELDSAREREVTVQVVGS
jgi:isopentenyl-diphosphate Delta-isomerase